MGKSDICYSLFRLCLNILKPKSYSTYKAKECVGFTGRSGCLLCGFPTEHNDNIYRITSEKDVIIKSIVFLNPIVLTGERGRDFGKKFLSELNNLFSA